MVEIETEWNPYVIVIFCNYFAERDSAFQIQAFFLWDFAGTSSILSEDDPSFM